jgi:hypothetical protein
LRVDAHRASDRRFWGNVARLFRFRKSVPLHHRLMEAIRLVVQHGRILDRALEVEPKPSDLPFNLRETLTEGRAKELFKPFPHGA